MSKNNEILDVIVQVYVFIIDYILSGFGVFATKEIKIRFGYSINSWVFLELKMINFYDSRVSHT